MLVFAVPRGPTAHASKAAEPTSAKGARIVATNAVARGDIPRTYEVTSTSESIEREARTIPRRE